MAGKDNRTKTIKFRVTPTEHQLLKRAYALQKRGWFRTHSKYCRAVLTQHAKQVIAEASVTDAGANAAEKKAAGK